MVEGENAAVVDLFDLRHARKVLAAFGRAYGGAAGRAGRSHRDSVPFWIKRSRGLAQDGKVISVRLALFAEMVKGEALDACHAARGRRYGGSRRDVPGRDLQRPTAPTRAPLSPESGPGRLESLAARERHRHQGPDAITKQELRAGSGYANHPRDFADLIHILDPELRLLTPTDPEGKDEGGTIKTSGRPAPV